MSDALQVLVTPAGRSDQADASVVLAVARGFAEWEAATGQRAGHMKPLREVIWFYWHHPRLPRPLVSNKYPYAFPWTPAARAAMRQPKRELIFEHMRPLALLMREMLTEHGGGIDRIVELLRGGGLDAVVMTKHEDALVTRHGYGEKMPPGWRPGDDPYERYRASGIDPVLFAPLSADS